MLLPPQAQGLDPVVVTAAPMVIVESAAASPSTSSGTAAPVALPIDSVVKNTQASGGLRRSVPARVQAAAAAAAAVATTAWIGEELLTLAVA